MRMSAELLAIGLRIASFVPILSLCLHCAAPNVAGTDLRHLAAGNPREGPSTISTPPPRDNCPLGDVEPEVLRCEGFSLDGSPTPPVLNRAALDQLSRPEASELREAFAQMVHSFHCVTRGELAPSIQLQRLQALTTLAVLRREAGATRNAAALLRAVIEFDTHERQLIEIRERAVYELFELEVRPPTGSHYSREDCQAELLATVTDAISRFCPTDASTEGTDGFCSRMQLIASEARCRPHLPAMRR